MLTSLLIASTVLSAAKPTAAFAPKVRPYDALSYRIELKFKDADTFDNKLIMTLKTGKKPVPEIELDSRGLSIGAITINDEAATFRQVDEPALRTGTIFLKGNKRGPKLRR